MQILFHIIRLIGLGVILAGFGTMLNAAFDLGLGLRTGGSKTELPADWESAFAFIFIGIIFFAIGQAFSSDKIRAKMKEHKGLALLVWALFFGGLFGGAYLYIDAFNQKLELYKQIEKDNSAAVKTYLEIKKPDQDFKQKLLEYAVRDKSKKTLDYLISLKLDVNEPRMDHKQRPVPLIKPAVNQANGEIVATLLRAGAKTDFIDYDFEENLLASALRGYTEIEDRRSIVVVLLKAGLDVNARDKHKETPLMRAAETFDLKLIALLLDHGADINAQNEFQETVLMSLIDAYKGEEADKLPAVKYLLSRGADKSVKTGGNSSAQSVAERRGYKQIQALLK